MDTRRPRTKVRRGPQYDEPEDKEIFLPELLSALSSDDDFDERLWPLNSPSLDSDPDRYSPSHDDNGPVHNHTVKSIPSWMICLNLAQAPPTPVVTTKIQQATSII